MQGGFNTNIRHRGVLFHVQTEDSGRANPHVITHLYHGGTILSSAKCDYLEQVDSPDLTRTVRGLMEKQHKAMLKRLRGGEFNEVIQQRLGDAIFQEAGEQTAGDTQPEVGPVTPEPARSPPEAARTFGEGIVSQKPLDEVVLEYLVENARKRRRPTKPPQ